MRLNHINFENSIHFNYQRSKYISYYSLAVAIILLQVICIFKVIMCTNQRKNNAEWSEVTFVI